MDQHTGLETCTACGQPFIVPVALLELVDEGLYLLALRCNNCDGLFTGIHEDAELEALEHANDRALAQMESALQTVTAAIEGRQNLALRDSVVPRRPQSS